MEEETDPNTDTSERVSDGKSFITFYSQLYCHSSINTSPSEQIAYREDFSFTDVFAMISELEDKDDDFSMQSGPMVTKQTRYTLPRDLLRVTGPKMTSFSRREKYRSLDETQMMRQETRITTSERKMTVIPTSSKFQELSRGFKVMMMMLK